MTSSNAATFQRLRWLCDQQPDCAELLSLSEQQQTAAGYFHTLREILQQPATWLDTAERLIAKAPVIEQQLNGITSLVLTGSGSSQYAGECVAQVLQRELQIPVQAIDGGALLTHGTGVFPPGRPGLMVSLARSGDSPESLGALSRIRESNADIRQLGLTCNGNGGLAQANVPCVVLDDRTNDRSLVMTSSFTNLVLSARFLGMTGRPEEYRRIVRQLSEVAVGVLKSDFGALARIGRGSFTRAVFLGSGPRLGAAHEGALKMLEMTAGRIVTITESYLGLRHGPMSYLNDHTLVVCFLSCDPTLRAYEADLIRELDRKELGAVKVIAGADVDPTLAGPGDTIVQVPGLSAVGDDNAAVIDVIIAQLLAFFRCRREGLKPDTPSEDGVINRVVESFKLYRGGERWPV